MEHIGKILGEILPEGSKRALTDRLISQEAKYSCLICRDVGYVYPLDGEGKPDFSRVVPCKCRIKQLEQGRKERLVRLCELPYATQHQTFENFKRDKSLASLEEAYKVALELAEEKGELRWVTLLGGVDRGKTHLAIAICRRWLARGKPARYIFVPLMLDDLRRGYDPDAERSFDRQFEFLMNVDLLVLDDLGAGKATKWAVEKLEIIIDYRYINGLPLVVTANSPIDEFSFRIASRLQRFQDGRVIVIDAPEYRTRKAKLSGKAKQV